MKPMLMVLFFAIGGAVAMAQQNQPQSRPSSGAPPSAYQSTPPSTYQPQGPAYQAAVPVAPQVYGGGSGGWGWSGGGTAAGNALQGMASVVNARGNYNLSTSAAAINMTQAQKQEIQNWSSFTNTYFDLRATNRRARTEERGKPLTEEQLNRIAQAGAPKPLAAQQLDAVSGKIAWPSVLQDDKFQEQRDALEAAFAARANYGTMPWQEQQNVQSATNAMLDELSGMISDLPPMDYMAAKRFIQSLAYAARKPVS